MSILTPNRMNKLNRSLIFAPVLIFILRFVGVLHRAARACLRLMIFYASTVVDIVLNALAIEFITQVGSGVMAYRVTPPLEAAAPPGAPSSQLQVTFTGIRLSSPQLDEAVAESWDRDKRIVRAGACELVIRRHLLLHDLKKLKETAQLSGFVPNAPASKRRHLSRASAADEADDSSFEGPRHTSKRKSKLLASSQMGTLSAQSTTDRQDLIKEIVGIEMQKKKFGFGLLTRIFMRLNDALEEHCGRLFSENVMFERFAPYLTSVDWKTVLACGPPDFADVARFRCRPLTHKDGDKEYLERETLPYIPPSGVIEKEIVGRLFFYGSLQKLAKEVAEAEGCVGKFNCGLNGVFDLVLFWSMALVQLLFPFGIAAFVVFGPYCYANLPQ